jgi:REP element-mobilizing transposase RayT
MGKRRLFLAAAQFIKVVAMDSDYPSLGLSHTPNPQHQNWDRFVRHEKEFAERLNYMHLNPVKKGLAKRQEDWRRSS